jgi:hypothetical protein
MKGAPREHTRGPASRHLLDIFNVFLLLLELFGGSRE